MSRTRSSHRRAASDLPALQLTTSNNCVAFRCKFASAVTAQNDDSVTAASAKVAFSGPGNRQARQEQCSLLSQRRDRREQQKGMLSKASISVQQQHFKLRLPSEVWQYDALVPVMQSQCCFLDSARLLTASAHLRFGRYSHPLHAAHNSFHVTFLTAKHTQHISYVGEHDTCKRRL